MTAFARSEVVSVQSSACAPAALDAAIGAATDDRRALSAPVPRAVGVDASQLPQWLGARTGPSQTALLEAAPSRRNVSNTASMAVRAFSDARASRHDATAADLRQRLRHLGRDARIDAKARPTLAGKVTGCAPPR